MLKFDALIRAIHQAAVSANRALVAENVKRLSAEYFVPAAGAQPQAGSLLDAALAAAQSLAGREGVDAAAVERLISSLRGVRDALGGGASGAKSPTALAPRTIDVLYPAPTADGVVEKTVKVPLIALLPVTLPEIAEMRLMTPLEVSEQGDGLNVTFPGKPSATDGSEGPSAHWSTLEIVVRPADGPEALKTLIEGYEKVLRAQIP